MPGTQAGRVGPEIRVGAAADVAAMLAADLEAHVRGASAPGRRYTVAIPGGSVAVRCFPRLAGLSMDWARLEFFWVDERAVPPDDPRSNYGLARTLWLAPARVPEARIHRMPGEAGDLQGAARAYGRELARTTGDPPRLDYVLLGVGPDGHVASLFPGHPALEREQPTLAIEDAPRPSRRRLTLSLPVLIRAARVVIVAFGKAKARVIREAVEEPGSRLPVSRVARGAGRCALLLDRAAAGGLARRC